MMCEYKAAALAILGVTISEEKTKINLEKDQKDFEQYVKPFLKELDKSSKIEPIFRIGPVLLGIKNADDAIAIASLGPQLSFGVIMEVISARFITETLKFGGTYKLTKGSKGHWDIISSTTAGTILTQVKSSRDGMPAKLPKEELKQLIAHGYMYAKLTNEKTFVALMRTTGQLVLSFDIYACFI